MHYVDMKELLSVDMGVLKVGFYATQMMKELQTAMCYTLFMGTDFKKRGKR